MAASLGSGGWVHGLRVARAYLKLAVVSALQYRADFVAEGLTGLMWVGVAVVPLWVVFADRRSVAGWSWEESLVVMGLFTLMKAVLEGAVSPSLLAVVEHIRRGTLDFVLLKPADAQLLVSVAKVRPWKLLDAVAGLGILGWALVRVGRVPTVLDGLVAVVMFGVSVWVLYSMWILVVCISFRAVRVDNLGYLLGSITDAARWPVQVFQGALRALFTWVIPLALMTTFPAQALLGRLPVETALSAVGLGVVFVVLARLAWLGSLRFYTSASS